MAKTKGTNGAAATTTTTTTTNGGRTHTTPSAKASYVQMSKLFATGAHAMDATDRVKVLTALSKPVSEAAPGELGSVEPMAVWEEVLAALFLLIFVGSMLWIPLALLLFVIYVRDPVAWAVLVVAWLGLTLHPLKRYHDLVHSPLNRLLFKYFSLRMASDVQIDPEGQYIFVAPPHGVLPMGNLLTVHAMRNINGLDFRGLTTSAALTLPLFRHYLGSIGTIAASSHIASDYLDQGWSLGISSGGVAEIFETNNPHEVVLMKERKGFVKLALRKGVAIVPCFIFGTCLFGVGESGSRNASHQCTFRQPTNQPTHPSHPTPPSRQHQAALGLVRRRRCPPEPLAQAQVWHVAHLGPVRPPALVPPAGAGRDGRAHHVPQGGGGAQSGNDRQVPHGILRRPCQAL